MSLGNSFPVRSVVPDTVKVQGVWTGGGNGADCTHDAADWNRGIESVKYDAGDGDGVYTIKFVDVGQQIVGFSVNECKEALATPRVWSLDLSSWDSAAKTVKAVASTGGGAATTSKLLISVEFTKNGP